jgi:hypothetical protein
LLLHRLGRRGGARCLFSIQPEETMKTDSQLQQNVMAELKWEPSVHAAQIGVEVKNGVVTLTGEVSSFVEKWNAERAAQRVNGVKALTESGPGAARVPSGAAFGGCCWHRPSSSYRRAWA